MKEPSVPTLELVTLVLSTDVRRHALVRASAPESMQVISVAKTADLCAVLARFPTFCALVVDTAMPTEAVLPLLELCEERWPGTERLAIQSVTSPKSINDAYEHARECAFLPADDAVESTKAVTFLRQALDRRLRWAAELLMYARGRGLRGAALETFIAYTLHQVRRSELSDYMGLSETATRYRVSKTSSALGAEGRFTDLGQRLMSVPPKRPPTPLLIALEAAALKVRRAAVSE